MRQYYCVLVCDIWCVCCTKKLQLQEQWAQQEGIMSRSTQQITAVLAPCAAEYHVKRYSLPFAIKFTSSHTLECTIVWNNQIKSVPELSSLDCCKFTVQSNEIIYRVLCKWQKTHARECLKSFNSKNRMSKMTENS